MTGGLSRRGLLALAPLLAARCAVLPTPSCTPNTVPMAINQALPFVPVTVNGWPLTALLDTGAERTLVAEALLPALGLPIDPRRLSFQTGATGMTAARPVAQLARLRLGGFEVANHTVGVIGRPSMTGPDGNPPQLILGGDILGLHDLDIDLPGRRLTLIGPHCGTAAPGFPRPGYALPIRVVRNHILTPVQANGVALEAVLDTGANLIFVARRRADALGISEAELAAAPQHPVRGINSETRNLVRARLRSLRIGPELLTDVPVLVGDGVPADMVIGTPWLGARRVLVSYAGLRILVAG